MAWYTYKGNTASFRFATRVIFSTGRDMVIGEQLDLTAQEISEIAKISERVNIVPGQIGVTLTHLNTPTIPVYTRVGTTAVAVKK